MVYRSITVIDLEQGEVITVDIQRALGRDGWFSAAAALVSSIVFLHLARGLVMGQIPLPDDSTSSSGILCPQLTMSGLSDIWIATAIILLSRHLPG
jgi:hypothetical protein